MTAITPEQAEAQHAVNTARIAVLEESHRNMANNVARIEQAQAAGLSRLERKLDHLESDLVNRPTEAMARSMARVQAVAATCGTGLVSAVIFIAMNT